LYGTGPLDDVRNWLTPNTTATAWLALGALGS
jgi:hypothetical protein